MRDAGVARGAAGGAGLRAGGAARDSDQGAGDRRAWDEPAGGEGAPRDGARTGMAGGVRPAAGWPLPWWPPSGNGTGGDEPAGPSPFWLRPLRRRK